MGDGVRHATMSSAGSQRKLLIVAATLFFIGVGYVTVLRATKAFKQTDFTIYIAAAHSVLRGGEDLYRLTNERGWNYNYPPLFAVLMVPFAKMSLFWAALTWYVISVILAASAVRMCVAMVHDHSRGTPGPLLYALPLCLIGWPLMSALTRGQASVLLLWLVVAAVFYNSKGRDIVGSACLAGAIVVKVFPVVLLAYFVWRKHWRFVVGTFVGVALGAFVLPAGALGWQRNLSQLQEWVRVLAKPALNIEAADRQSQRYLELLSPEKSRNQSLQAVLGRLTGAPKMREIAAGISLVMFGAIVFVGRRSGVSSEFLIVSAVFAWTLLMPPVSETHYFMLLLLPLTAMVRVAAHGPDAATQRLARIVLVVFGALNIAGKPVEYYGPMFWGTLVLWAVLIVTVRRFTTGTVSYTVASPLAPVH